MARYVRQHGKGLVTKAVLISSVPPIMVQSATNPDGVPLSVFDDIRKGTAFNRPHCPGPAGAVEPGIRLLAAVCGAGADRHLCPGRVLAATAGRLIRAC